MNTLKKITKKILYPAVFRKIRKWLEDNPDIRRYLSEPEYRARISLYAGLIINFAYIVFKAGLGIYYRSVWYGAVAVYYLVLSAIRFFLVQSDRKTLTEKQALHRYRLTGLSMLFLNMAMAGMKRFVKCFFELLTKTFRRGGKRGGEKGAKCACGRLKAIFAGRWYKILTLWISASATP